MKIAILTSGILPVPAVQGGAVENLIDFYLQYNDTHKIHDITVFSVNNQQAVNHIAQTSTVNHYHYIDTNSLWAKIKRKIYLHTAYNITTTYNNHFIEFFLEQAIKHIKKNDFDVILLENRPSYALKLRKVTKAKLICHLHNELLHAQMRGALDIYNSLDKIITVSNYITNCIKTINPEDKKCVTIYNGINLELFSRNRSFNINRSQLGLNVDDFVIVYSGRINSDKGIAELIDAMILLKDEIKIKLLVIGSPFFAETTKDNNFILGLKTKAEVIRGKIVFTGFIPYPEMPAYLSLADIAVIPSIWDDPLPTTVLEAQAMALPLIVSNRGGIPEELGNDNAITVSTGPHFTKDLQNAILQLYQHPEQRIAMSESSKHNSIRFDKNRFAFEILNAFNV